MNELPIKLYSKDASHMSVLLRPSAVRMIFLPEEVIAEREVGVDLTPSSDINLSLLHEMWDGSPLHTVVDTGGVAVPGKAGRGRDGRLVLKSFSAEDLQADLSVLGAACSFTLLESEHKAFPGKRVLLNMSAVNEVKYRERGNKLRIYLNFPGAQMYLESADIEDFDADVSSLTLGVPGAIHFSVTGQQDPAQFVVADVLQV